VAEDAQRIGEALMAVALASPLRPDQVEAFRRNGLRLIAVPAQSLPAIEDAVGPLSMNRNEWHGQIVEWRELHERRMNDQGRVVAINGRVRAYRNGRFQLLVRSWVVMMEDGPYVQMDLVPCFLEGVDRPATFLEQPATPRGELFERLSISVRLDPNVAIVLTCEAPHVAWPSESAPGPVQRTALAPRRGFGPGAAPPDVRGPDASAPMTLGPLFLGDDGAGASRGLLVFVPRIPDTMFITASRPADRVVAEGSR
jgi:hypothetical protein